MGATQAVDALREQYETARESAQRTHFDVMGVYVTPFALGTIRGHIALVRDGKLAADDALATIEAILAELDVLAAKDAAIDDDDDRFEASVCTCGHPDCGAC